MMSDFGEISWEQGYDCDVLRCSLDAQCSSSGPNQVKGLSEQWSQK
jgi:hypothetical protein